MQTYTYTHARAALFQPQSLVSSPGAVCRQAAKLEGVHDSRGDSAEHFGWLLHVRGPVQSLGQGLPDGEAGSHSYAC